MVRHVFDRRGIPLVSALLIVQALALAVLVPSFRIPVLLWTLSTVLGAFGVALIVLRRRWSYARILLSGCLLTCTLIAVFFLAGSWRPLQPYFGRFFDVVWILFLGALGAGGWHFFCGPLVIDKSEEPALPNKR